MARSSKNLGSMVSFTIEMLVYAIFVITYFFLVLLYLGDWIEHIFKTNKIHYALLAVGLIAGQSVVLDWLTIIVVWLVQIIRVFTPVVRHLVRPFETSSIRMEIPGLVIYRFGGPLYYFNAPHFARRIQEIVKTADPPLEVLLINAEAMVDMDMNGLEILEEVHVRLRRQGIVLALCEVKGQFRKELMSTPLPRRSGFKIYPNVAAAVQELSEQRTEK